MLRKLRKAKLFNAIMILLLVGSVYSSKALQWSTVNVGTNTPVYHGLVATDDGKWLAVYTSHISKNGLYDQFGNFVNVETGGIGYRYTLYTIYGLYGLPIAFNSAPAIFEILNGKIRIVGNFKEPAPKSGNWVDLKGSGVSQIQHTYRFLFESRYRTINHSIEVSNGKIRYCVSNIGCGSWITLNISSINSNSCPSGYSFNSSTNKCEANPTITCPAGYTYNSSIKKCQANPVTSCPTN